MVVFAVAGSMHLTFGAGQGLSGEYVRCHLGTVFPVAFTDAFGGECDYVCPRNDGSRRHSQVSAYHREVGQGLARASVLILGTDAEAELIAAIAVDAPVNHEDCFIAFDRAIYWLFKYPFRNTKIKA